MVSRKLVSFLLSELKTVRVICKSDGCRVVTELPMDQLVKRFGGETVSCPHCGGFLCQSPPGLSKGGRISTTPHQQGVFSLAAIIAVPPAPTPALVASPTRHNENLQIPACNQGRHGICSHFGKHLTGG